MSEEKKDTINQLQDAPQGTAQAAEAAAKAEDAAGQPLPELVLSSETADREKVEAVIDQLEKAQAESPQAPDVQAKLASDLDSTLTEEERRAVNEFSERIDVSNPST